MRIYLKSFAITILFILLSSCGYKSLVKENPINLNIENFNTQKGDKKLGKIIKSEIMLYSSLQSNRDINIILEIDKKKLIKEKNLKNRVTKYNLTLNVTAYVRGDFDDKFSFTQSSSTSVTASSFSNFLDEERVYSNLAKLIASDFKNILALNY